MRKYFNPEMNVASFDREAVATTASEALQNWQNSGDGTATRYSATVDFNEMAVVNIEF